MKLLAILAIPIAVLLSEAAAWVWMNPNHDKVPVIMPGYRFPGDERIARLTTGGMEEIKKSLSCDTGLRGVIRGRYGSVVSVGFFEWNDSQSTRVSEVLAHMPEVCMGMVGVNLEEMFPSRRVSFGDFELIFDATRFRGADGKPIFIFKAPWIDGVRELDLRRGPHSGIVKVDDQRMFRLESVKRRYSPRYARVLMGGVHGATTVDEAWEIFSEAVLKDVYAKHG